MKKMSKHALICTCFFYSFTSSAWTLGNSNRLGFPLSNIVIKLSSNTCVNAGFSASSMETLISDSINQFWAKVPTSSLELTTGGVLSGVDVSADDLTAAVPKTTLNTIIVGCSSNATTFASSSTLAVGNISCSSAGCRGGVLLNDTASTKLNSLSRTTIIATFAHELGHALGLGHSSSETALMYYASFSGKTQVSLTQDDIDGISYLYPSEKKIGGLAGACGTVDFKSSDDSDKPGGNGQFLLSILFGFAIIFVFSRLNKMNRFFQI